MEYQLAGAFCRINRIAIGREQGDPGKSEEIRVVGNDARRSNVLGGGHQLGIAEISRG